MALSKSTRISILLVIDLAFFFVEIIVGYAVGSLALVADSFHMLNDVMSLLVALYAIRLTTNQTPSALYSYGWHRAEILAALINGVFLLALCFSISMEAIERFFSVPEISNPKLVVIVGSLGLLSNLLGLFLFHDHGHSHGHSHGSHSSAVSHSSGTSTPTPLPRPQNYSSESEPPLPKPIPRPRASSSSSTFVLGHPAQTRASLVLTAQEMGFGDIGAGSPSMINRVRSPEASVSETTALLRRSTSDVEAQILDEPTDYSAVTSNESSHHHGHAHGHSHSHSNVADHGHSEPADHDDDHGHGHGHSHSDMNINALLLHVLGDALGNVGVIASGLIIWLTNWPGKYYCDPAISLVITIIIFSSALPLVKSASFILLQGVPSNVSLPLLRQKIRSISGVISIHELHVWQLSETKAVASVHVCVSGKDTAGGEFMRIAADIRNVLHKVGVHNSAIQPEFVDGDVVARNGELMMGVGEDGMACLIPCAPNAFCSPENGCCPPLKSVEPSLHGGSERS